MPEPVGVVEVAARLGVTRHAVNAWRVRNLDPPFPQPRWTVGGRPAWDWELDIKPWAKATDRLR